jgi:hypothetical protein
MQRSSLLVVAVVAILGCGDHWASNTVDLDAVEGAPVKVSQVRMRHSRAVGLSATPAQLSSGDAPNAIGVEFSIDKLAATAPHAGVGARLSCRVGDFVVVGPLAHDASDRLASLATGTSITGSETFFPNAFTTAIPSVCETTFLSMVRPPLEVPPIGSPEPDPEAPGPEADDLVLGTTCLADGTLRTGPCTSAELPRTPGASPLTISKLSASVAPHREGGFGAMASVLITAGPGVPRRWIVRGHVQCTPADAEPGRPLSMLAIGHGLAPGESVVDQGFTSPQQPWSEQPTACTLRFESNAGGERANLGEYCLQGGETTAGACA